MATEKSNTSTAQLDFSTFQQQVLNDYQLACESREASLLGRKEVLTGKAKFGIFGDGKEVPQLAMAKSFLKGDWRSGYYRDQTFMMAIGKLTPLQYFSALYAHTDIKFDPMSAGRQMGGHFTTHSLDENFEFIGYDLVEKNGDILEAIMGCAKVAHDVAPLEIGSFWHNARKTVEVVAVGVEKVWNQPQYR